MTRNHKFVVAVILILCGILLIGWNLRDPDAAYREPPKVEKVETVVTRERVPAPVQATIQRLMKPGDKLQEIQEERRGEELKYEVEIVSGNRKTEYEVSPDGTILEQDSEPVKP